MKRLLLFTLLMVPLLSMAQDDDLYFVPKKKVKTTTGVSVKDKSEWESDGDRTYSVYSNNSRSDDEYNRRGEYANSDFQISGGIDSISARIDTVVVYRDRLIHDEDYFYTRRISRIRPWSYYSSYYWDLYDYDYWAYVNGWGGYYYWNPWYRSGWGYYGWGYDPWYWTHAYYYHNYYYGWGGYHGNHGWSSIGSYSNRRTGSSGTTYSFRNGTSVNGRSPYGGGRRSTTNAYNRSGSYSDGSRRSYMSSRSGNSSGDGSRSSYVNSRSSSSNSNQSANSSRYGAPSTSRSSYSSRNSSTSSSTSSSSSYSSSRSSSSYSGGSSSSYSGGGGRSGGGGFSGGGGGRSGGGGGRR